MTIQRIIFFLTVEAFSYVWLHKSIISDWFEKFLISQMKKQMENFPPSLVKKFIPGNIKVIEEKRNKITNNDKFRL